VTFQAATRHQAPTSVELAQEQQPPESERRRKREGELMSLVYITWCIYDPAGRLTPHDLVWNCGTFALSAFLAPRYGVP
jgi:hypothetical protein